MRLHRLAALVLALALSTTAARESQAKTDEPHPGKRDYETYCASCHGIAGDGAGPVAPALKTPPADLTRLGERYGMPLPRNKLMPFIDGRAARRIHGTREMPVWGKVLHEDLSGAREREMMVRGTIYVILDYIESLQAPGANGSD